MKKFDVVYSKLSEIQYLSHLDFLSNVSENAVKRLVAAFKTADNLLRKNPLRYPLFYKDFRKLTIKDRYIIMYKIVGNVVYVNKILDMRTSEYNDIFNEIND